MTVQSTELYSLEAATIAQSV